MKIAFILGWIFFALEVAFIVATLTSKNAGNDPSGRGLTGAFAAISIPLVLLAGGLLLWGQNSPSKVVQWIGVLFVSVPFLIGGSVWVSNEFKTLSRRLTPEPAGRFSDPKLTKIARAIDDKDFPAVEALVQNGKVNWTAKDQTDATLLEHAVKRILNDYSGDASVQRVTILLAHGAPKPSERVVEEIFNGNTPGTVPLFKALLDAGVDPNSRDRDGLSLVHTTHTWKALEKLKVLDEHGADLKVLGNRTDRLRWTALMSAVYMETWEPALYLLEHGVDPAYEAPDGKSLASLLAEHKPPTADYKKLLDAVKR